jgi:hypothetical protein
MTKIPHGVHSKLKIVIHAVTTTPLDDDVAASR